MTTSLEHLMARAIADQREESAFFQALLDATIYAHIPMTDRVDVQSDKIRFVQFHRPDNGQLTLPFFTDLTKARFAAQSNVQVIALTGRVFLELTRGATVMLDPNDNGCTLYPEEVEVLLRTGQVAAIQPFTVEEASAPLVGPSKESPAWLIDALILSLAKLPFVEVAYLGGVFSRTEVPEQAGLLIVLGGERAHAERAVHAVLTALQPLAAMHEEMPIDMTHFDPAENIPAWITRVGLQPFYERAWGARLHLDHAGQKRSSV
ncbi:hypothetical protein EKH79_03170 [Dyella dinghuensis]|uniref:Enhanced serine sensitivity protein SseB n=1 Tax=Dyella dinghuensis TaxID=1920169 RepID=A0A3S0PHN1_9GAMM|nr:enhanced serine sensitivity protein SseB C-terminal domain-containing protein [Dyella dinghuensis]RUL66825.1 hypothetical protein EKH79_03170 [Dyella dinghuensis]